jgi:predicted DNA-binding protein
MSNKLQELLDKIAQTNYIARTIEEGIDAIADIYRAKQMAEKYEKFKKGEPAVKPEEVAERLSKASETLAKAKDLVDALTGKAKIEN